MLVLTPGLCGPVHGQAHCIGRFGLKVLTSWKRYFSEPRPQPRSALISSTECIPPPDRGSIVHCPWVSITPIHEKTLCSLAGTIPTALKGCAPILDSSAKSIGSRALSARQLCSPSNRPLPDSERVAGKTNIPSYAYWLYGPALGSRPPKLAEGRRPRCGLARRGCLGEKGSLNSNVSR